MGNEYLLMTPVIEILGKWWSHVDLHLRLFISHHFSTFHSKLYYEFLGIETGPEK